MHTIMDTPTLSTSMYAYAYYVLRARTSLSMYECTLVGILRARTTCCILYAEYATNTLVASDTYHSR